MSNAVKKATIRVLDGNAETADDFIYNRFDLTNRTQSYVIEYESESFNAHFSVCFERDTAYLGVWLVNITKDAAKNLFDFIFSNYKEIKYIRFKNSLCKFSKRCDIEKGNHWKLILPETEEELLSRTTRKARYNLKRTKRLITEELGEYKIVEYSLKDGISSEVEKAVEQYFEYKKISHGADYGVSAKEYLKKYFVTNVYVLYLPNGIGSVLFSCEQGEKVYLENLSYSSEYKKYSLGAVLYEEFLINLISKKKSVLYLGGGNQEYKSHFGSIEDVVYSGTVYRSGLEFLRKVSVRNFKNNLRRKVFGALHKIKVFLNVRARIKRLKDRIKAKKELRKYDKNNSPFNEIIKNAGQHEKVIICAHPDDESLLFYNLLKQDNSIFVICLSNQMNSARREEFGLMLKEYGVSGIIINLPDFDYIRLKWTNGRLNNVMRAIKKYVSPKCVYTHNEEGDYGHEHHIAVNKAVLRNFDTDVFVYSGEHDTENLEEKKDFFEKVYKSQAVYSWHRDVFEREGFKKVK